MDVWEAVSEPTRRRIVELVAVGPRNAGAIAAEFTVSRPAVSQHLGVLVDAGILQVRRVGTQRIYSLEPRTLDTARDWLGEQADRWRRSLDRLEDALDRGEI
jgi:DNA-binding transcriptional ArsR family regulator